MNARNPTTHRMMEDQSLMALQQHYATRGWAKLSGVVQGDELRRLQHLIAQADATGKFKTRKSGVQADQATAEYEKTMRVLRRLWTDYPEIEGLCRRVGELVQRITDWPSTRLWSDRVFIKPGRKTGSRPTIWHQDLPKIPIDRRGFATVWITMSELPATKGAMSFLNGSHHLGPLGATAQLGEESDLSELLGQDDWSLVDGCTTAAPLAAGDATIHHGLTLHRARANVEEQDRIVLAISYVDGEALYTGGANPVTDNLGIAPYKRMEHELLPIVARR